VRSIILGTGVVLVASILGLALLEFGASTLGLGEPVLYDSNPIYGYRPLPNQSQQRSNPGKAGARRIEVRFNNLGLRCDRDWDADPSGKVLFLGDSVAYGGSYVAYPELFSTLAARDSGLSSCNGAVNAWGVENIHGLVVGTGFMPAELYVTVVPEGDFYRGLTRIQGQPFFNVKPRWALEEALQYAAFMLMNRRYVYWEHTAPIDLRRKVIERAAARLAEMEKTLRQRGHRHLLFLHPTRAQAAGRTPREALIQEALAKQGLSAVHLLDEIPLTPEQVSESYVDSVHLSVAGHARWAEAIRQHLVRTP
jgi:hypothetical protein